MQSQTDTFVFTSVCFAAGDAEGSELVQGRDVLHNNGKPRSILHFEVIDGDTARLYFVFNRQQRWADCRIRGIDAPDPKRETFGTAKQLAMEKLAALAARDLHYHLSHATFFSFDVGNGNGGWTPHSGRPVVSVVVDGSCGSCGSLSGRSGSGSSMRNIAEMMVRDGHVIEWYGQFDHSPWRYLNASCILLRLGSYYAGLATADIYRLPPR